MSQATQSSQTRLRTATHRLPEHRHNLPAYQTTIVGRSDECQKISALLKSQRLVTLVGPGGIGKTSLALALAKDLFAQFEYGVYFVSLSGITSHLFLVSAIAEAIQLSFHTDGDFKAQLLDYLYDLNILLVLDNYEHLLPDTGLLTEILQSTQQVKLLVTSRHHLNLQAERIFKLRGLSYPRDLETKQVENYGAIKLFIGRAQSVCPDFKLTQKNLTAVVSICQLVDGLPLAIELAASWTRALTCQQIVRQIEKDLGFLATTWQDLPPKHHSIRGVLTQSWNMLEPSAQVMLRKLAIFQGNFDLEAAQQIVGVSTQELAYLVDRSLLKFDPIGYYQIHPLMQQYALEMLVEADEFEHISERHCDYFAHFLQQRQTKIQGTRQRLALKQIGTTIENIRQAWNWAIQQHKTTQVGESLETLFQFYALRGYYQDGESCFAQAAEQLRKQSQKIKTLHLISKLAIRQGIFLRKMGRYSEAQAIFQEQLPRVEKQNTFLEIILCLRELTYITYHYGNYAEARRLGMDCLALCKKTGNTAKCINMLHILSTIARDATCYEEAYQYLEEALALSDADRFPQLHARSQLNLGLFCNHRGDFDKAQSYYRDALAIFREIADRPGESTTLLQLGIIDIHLSYYSRAIQCYEDAIPILREIGDQRALGRAFSNLGVIFQRLGCCERARTYLEHALKILRRVGEKRGQCIVLSNTSHLYFQQCDFAKAQSYAQELLEIANSIDDRMAQGFAWTNMGNALSGQKDWQAAQSAYQRSIELRKAIGEAYYIIEPLAGLARNALTRGNLQLAVEYVETLLAAEDRWKKSGEILQILYICYQVLNAHQDVRASNVLALAHERLQNQVARINEVQLQRSYLENVPVHREIRTTFAQEQRQQTPPKDITAAQIDPRLTRRELEVLQWVAAGHSNQEIADGLCISISTVKRHITNLHHKLGVKRRTQAVSCARELGLL